MLRLCDKIYSNPDMGRYAECNQGTRELGARRFQADTRLRISQSAREPQYTGKVSIVRGAIEDLTIY
jgi:hypothetical protein